MGEGKEGVLDVIRDCGRTIVVIKILEMDFVCCFYWTIFVLHIYEVGDGL